jgi:hypothetical protein
LRSGTPPAEGSTAEICLQFLHLIEGGKAKRRMLYKLQIRRAAQGTESKPGDWRAAHALGSITDAEEFVIEQRIKFSMEREDALDRMEAAFDNAPEQLTRDQACDIALLAVAGRVRMEAMGETGGGAPHGPGRGDAGGGEAVRSGAAAPEAARVP